MVSNNNKASVAAAPEAASRMSSTGSKRRFGGSIGTTTTTVAKLMVLGFVVWNIDFFHPTTQQQPSSPSSSLVVSSFTPPLVSMLTTKPATGATAATDRKKSKTLLLQPQQLLEPVDSKQRTLSLLKQSKKKYFDDEDEEFEEEGIEYYSLANIDQYKNEKQKQRKLLKIEIQLLESLMYSDDGIEELVSLWNNNDDVVGDEDNSKNDSMLLEAELLLRLGHDAQRAATRSTSSDATEELQQRHKQNETTKASKGKWKTSNTHYYAEERVEQGEESKDTNGYWDRAEALLQQYLLQLDADDEGNGSATAADGGVSNANDIGKHIMINNLKIGPMNQLAHLYLRQKRYSESIQMYQHILDIKPWHISALRGMVIVHQASSNNSNHNGVDTKYWSTKCLPPLPMNSYLSSDNDEEHSKYDRVDDMIDTKQYNRRKEWVSRMVSIAKQQLHDMMSSPSLSSNRPTTKEERRDVNKNKSKKVNFNDDDEDDEDVFSTSFSYYSTLSKTSSNSNSIEDRLKKINAAAAAAAKDPSADFSTLFDLDEEDCWQ